MSRPLTEYFKAVGSSQNMQNTSKRKHSLIKMPIKAQKSLKINLNNSAECVIDLVSDDEELCNDLNSTCRKQSNINGRDQFSIKTESSLCEEASNSSTSTIIYTPETPRKSQIPHSSHSRSPGSGDKFFSPVKKRNIKIKTPSKVKKRLCDILNANKEEDQVFQDACAGMDDKSVFLLSIINKCLTNNELKALLQKSSQELLSKCMYSMKPGIKLVCRLYWRKECWYRLNQIKKICSEKSNCDDAIVQEMLHNLTRDGILESNNCEGSKCDIGFEDYLALLKLEELKCICKDLKLKVNNKADAMECLRSYSRQKSNISNYLIGNKSDNASRVLKIVSSKTGPCFRLTEAARGTMKELYLLMYLGINYNVIREKKLELILIYDKIKRECYPDVDVTLDNAGVVFKTRPDFERYIQAINIYNKFLDATELTEKCAIIEDVYNLYKNIDKNVMTSYRETPAWLHRFTPPYLYVKILESGLQELKKMKAEKYIGVAVDIATALISQPTFRQHKKAEWYAEKALILDKFMCDAEGAANVLLEGFTSDLSDVAKDSLRPRALKMATRQTHAVSSSQRDALLQHATKQQILEKNLNAKHIYKIPMDLSKNRGKIKFETRTPEGRLVQEAEEFCIHHYITEGQFTHGGHWEGKIVTTIFFLLFWDIIYARLTGARGVYLTHYQEYPLDMFLESFYTNRKALIEERLKEIEESPIEMAVERMCVTWHSRPETELSGISRYIGWDNVYSVSKCLRPRHLAALCRRLATNYGYSHSGFPDLTLWNQHTNEIKFVEVKTDSDKPSLKQIQWMHYMQENGIGTEFCYVGVNTTRCKARNS